MHPGPMNRGVEIAGDVADGPNSGVIDQVRAGLVVRMAVLYDLLAGPGPADARAAGQHGAGRGRRRGGAGGGVMAERLYQMDAAPAGVVIAGGRLVDPTAGFHGEALDVRIEGGRIVEIGHDLQGADTETIDAGGLIVTPGADRPARAPAHARTTRTRRTSPRARAAAAAGGFVAILAMPNTSPVGRLGRRADGADRSAPAPRP